MERRQLKMPTYEEMKMQANRYRAWVIKHERKLKAIAWLFIIFFDIIGIFATWVIITNRFRY